MKETLRLTNLGELTVGSEVNIERAAKYGDEIGGHVMSGHIVTTAEIAKIITSENNLQIWFRIFDQTLMKYILHKGFNDLDYICRIIFLNNSWYSHFLYVFSIILYTCGKSRNGCY